MVGITVSTAIAMRWRARMHAKLLEYNGAGQRRRIIQQKTDTSRPLANSDY
jgi:hypothetical protein